MMNIAIVGTGYVGLITGTCFAEMGTNVTCVDIRQDIVDKLNSGEIHIYEPGLKELVVSNVRDGQLKFTTSLKEAIDGSDVIFMAVGTPSAGNGAVDLKYVHNVARQIGEQATHYFTLVMKSTVPVGTSLEVRKIIESEFKRRNVNIEFDVASNPEFLKEGAAIKDFMAPDRIVIGTETDRARVLLERLYKPFMLNGDRFFFMDVSSAEMTKYAANSMLATRISFMNEIAGLCEMVGANIDMVRKAIGADHRIGSKFLYSGAGYGGSCFPKDVKALIHTGADKGYTMDILESVERVNYRQKRVLYCKLKKYFGDLSGKTIAILGLSFKPDTDDIREATSLVLIDQLLNNGAKVKVFDPISMPKAKEMLGDSVDYCSNKYDVITGVDAMVLVTEWRQFRLVNWKIVADLMSGRLVVDGRNIYNEQEIVAEGLDYVRIGKSN